MGTGGPGGSQHVCRVRSGPVISGNADSAFAGLQVIAIAADDPKADSLNDVEDVERCALNAVYILTTHCLPSDELQPCSASA